MMLHAQIILRDLDSQEVFYTDAVTIHREEDASDVAEHFRSSVINYISSRKDEMMFGHYRIAMPITGELLIDLAKSDGTYLASTDFDWGTNYQVHLTVKPVYETKTEELVEQTGCKLFLNFFKRVFGGRNEN